MGLQCWNCEHQKQISKSPALSPGGALQYIVTCIEECITFEIDAKSNPSDLPCWALEDNNYKIIKEEGVINEKDRVK